MADKLSPVLRGPLAELALQWVIAEFADDYGVRRGAYDRCEITLMGLDAAFAAAKKRRPRMWISEWLGYPSEPCQSVDECWDEGEDEDEDEYYD